MVNEKKINHNITDHVAYLLAIRVVQRSNKTHIKQTRAIYK